MAFTSFQTNSYDEDPFVWLALLGVRVVGLHVAPDDESVEVMLDPDDLAVRADQLQAEGDPLGEEIAKEMASGARGLVYEFEGDCCSTSWLADVVNPQAILGRRVTATESIELPEHLQAEFTADGEPRTRQEVDACYGWTLTSDKGTCTIAVRNSSNGYYGGWARLCGWTRGSDSWREITEDFSA